MKKISFDLYRFQLLPITRHAQIDAFHEIRSVEDIERNKNLFFNEILTEFPKLKHRLFELNQKILFHKQDVLCIKLGAHKTIERDNEHFRKERIDNWPNITIIISNEPNTQIIAVSRNIKTFSSSEVVINLLSSILNRRLRNYQLKMHIEAMFDKKEFWSIIEKNKARLQTVKFELISPNMSNISKFVKLELKQLNKDTNSHKTNLELNSPEGATLEINKNNEMVNSLVDYASNGGGDISIKVKGIRKKVHTSKSIKSVEVDELIAENLTYEQLIAFTEILNKQS